jgi:Flp pilus assembly protein TadG
MNRRRPATSQPRDRGAAAVEFALLLPVVLLLLFGIIDFGRALNAQITITQAAREGVRLESLGQTVATVQSRTVTAAAPGLTLPTGDVAPTLNPTTGSPATCLAGMGAAGTDAVVTVTYTFSYLTPVAAIGKMFGSNNFGSTLTATGEMPCET